MSDQMTIEEMEAETARIQKELEARRAKKAGKKKVAAKPDPAPSRRETRSETKGKNATFKNAHSVPAGPTLINKIEEQMDKRRRALADMIIAEGSAVRTTDRYILNKGRYEGFAGTLAILRSSSLKEEMARSNERLGIE